MSSETIKQTIHHLIDQIEDEDLLTIYLQLLERELRNSPGEFFSATDHEMIERAKASLKSVNEGRSRNIKDFRKEIELWKEKRAM